MAGIGFGHLLLLIGTVSLRGLERDTMWFSAYTGQVVLRCLYPSEYYHQRVARASLASSILLARLAAAVGETCFILQIAVRESESGFSRTAWTIVGCCAGAQACATLATVFKSRALFVLEGVLWTAIFASLFKAEADRRSRGMAAALALLFTYMTTVYLPLTVKQWKHESASSGGSVSCALYRAAFQVTVSDDVSFWKTEASWQVPYFVVGPVISFALLHLH